MIDVVFLLLIFFIVTQQTVMDEARAAVDLPSGVGRPGPVLIQAYVMPDGYQIRSADFARAVPLGYFETLPEQLGPGYPLLIKVSPDADHAQLVALLDTCKKVGLDKLQVITLKADD
jgi:biopolymer transport protein ExbD